MILPSGHDWPCLHPQELALLADFHVVIKDVANPHLLAPDPLPIGATPGSGEFHPIKGELDFCQVLSHHLFSLLSTKGHQENLVPIGFEALQSSQVLCRDVLLHLQAVVVVNGHSVVLVGLEHPAPTFGKWPPWVRAGCPRPRLPDPMA